MQVHVFTRNGLCAFPRPKVGLSLSDFLDRLLDPAVRLGTSTPKPILRAITLAQVSSSTEFIPGARRGQGWRAATGCAASTNPCSRQRRPSGPNPLVQPSRKREGPPFGDQSMLACTTTIVCLRRIFLVAAVSGFTERKNGRSALAAGIALHSLRNSIGGRLVSARHGILWVGFTSSRPALWGAPFCPSGLSR
jgi:hypothetical protein